MPLTLLNSHIVTVLQGAEIDIMKLNMTDLKPFSLKMSDMGTSLGALLLRSWDSPFSRPKGSM